LLEYPGEPKGTEGVELEAEPGTELEVGGGELKGAGESREGAMEPESATRNPVISGCGPANISSSGNSGILSFFLYLSILSFYNLLLYNTPYKKIKLLNNKLLNKITILLD